MFSKIRPRTALITALLFGALSLPAVPAHAESTSTPVPPALQGLVDRVSTVTLENGLKILLVRRPEAPVFAGQVWVKVGGVNESPGKTGAAHLLEHMAFKGTNKIGTKDYAREKRLLDELDTLMDAAGDAPTKEQLARLEEIRSGLSTLWVDNEFSRIYQRRGGVGLNAGTAKDYTMYQIELPSVAFELWCWMESERLLNPVFRQFYKEREVVKEERRMRTDDDPEGRMYEALLSTAYWSHPYRYPVVGYANDLNVLSRRDTESLRQIYYRPDNIVIALVGDIDPATATPLLKKYFGRLPVAQGEMPKILVKEEPQRGGREATVEFDAEPSLTMAYHKPVYPVADDLYFSILHSILAGGRSSILYRELVLERQLAVSVGTSEAPGELYPSLFYVAATPRRGIGSRMLMDEIQKIIDRVGKEGFSDEEFESAKKRVKASFLHGLDSNEDLAETLGHAELLWGDWEAVLKMYQLVDTAKPEDVKALVGKYLVPNKRTVVFLQRPEQMTTAAATGAKK